MEGSGALVEITPHTHDVLIDMVYAGPHNLTGAPVYESDRCWLHRDAESRLVQAVKLARLTGARLKVLDAYRSPQAHEVLCRYVTDPRYIADPKRGSHHSRGVAVDLTLVDGEGRELDMGSPFDAMVEASHHFNPALSTDVHRNRFLLLGIMTQAGFLLLEEEWWHYQLPEARSYPMIRQADSQPSESGPWR
jgi:zinc D-Ala-D-Ala dipeptidase